MQYIYSKVLYKNERTCIIKSILQTYIDRLYEPKTDNVMHISNITLFRHMSGSRHFYLNYQWLFILCHHLDNKKQKVDIYFHQCWPCWPPKYACLTTNANMIGCGVDENSSLRNDWILFKSRWLKPCFLFMVFQELCAYLVVKPQINKIERNIQILTFSDHHKIVFLLFFNVKKVGQNKILSIFCLYEDVVAIFLLISLVEVYSFQSKNINWFWQHYFH